MLDASVAVAAVLDEVERPGEDLGVLTSEPLGDRRAAGCAKHGSRAV